MTCNACVENQYFSGQGALLLATRDASGNPEGLRPVGNVSALTIGIETEEFEHKESCTGVRGKDLVLVTDISAAMNFTMESLVRENLALALFGESSAVTGAAVVDEAVTAYDNLWSQLEYISISAVTVNHAQDGASDYVTAGYGGGAAVAQDTYVTNVAGTAILKATTAGTDGAGGEPTWDLSAIGATTADGTVVWTYVAPVTLTEDTEYCLNEDAGGVNWLDVVDGEPYEVSYTYADQDDVQGLTSGVRPIRYAVFHGLNTAEDNKPVVVTAYRMSVAPLAELALITDEISQMEVETELLLDPNVTTGSQYFQIQQAI